jgi:hypothetical protein
MIPLLPSQEFAVFNDPGQDWKRDRGGHHVRFRVD